MGATSGLVKILTLNTWQKEGPWQKRWDVIFSGLKTLQPDVVGFQELFDYDWARDVHKRSGYCEVVFDPAIEGLVFLSQFPVLESKGVQLPTQSLLEDYKRCALYMKIKAVDEEIACFNTHLSWKLEDEATREKQAHDLLSFMDESTQGVERVLMGDLNAHCDKPEIQIFTEKGRMCDTYAKMHPGDLGYTWNHVHPYVKEDHGIQYLDRRLDYILTRSQGGILSKVKSAEILFDKPSADGVYASDHYGYIVEFG